MINVEQAITNKFPTFADKPALIRKPTLTLLKKLIYEDEINGFLRDHGSSKGVEFIDRVFDFFNFSYKIASRDKSRIPKSGRVVIIANHPIGSLDGLAILRLVSEVRSDVKIVANDMLMNFEGLHELLIPLDNMAGGSARRSYKRVIQALKEEQAIIVFPAGEVSRARPSGVKDTNWRPGFLHFSRKSSAPILPIHIHAKNSLLFYGASALFKPLGTALLAHEMFNKQSSDIRFSVGELIPVESLSTDQLLDRTLVKRLKKHLYKIGEIEFKQFSTQKKIAPPEAVNKLLKELSQAQKIGATRDNNEIYLLDYRRNSSVLKEIGRLRELTFRQVGEGTGQKRDLDEYDQDYRHLVLWNAENQEIAGSYRIGEGHTIVKKKGVKGLYTSSLYRYTPTMESYFTQGIELGRSFVAPQYWGKACLDYLWQGLGAYLAHNPDIRYLIGPVSMSADYPRELMDTLVYFYRRYYACPEELAKANHPYLLTTETMAHLDEYFGDNDSEAAFELMQRRFNENGHKLPVLFKQYTALFETGGFKSIVFSLDPDFGDCLDGLCMADITKLKPNKRKRYIGN
ncbi:GNAT family N-acyltransferase [Teredinibacter haidensis]|uniref:GNAT family N-acyltransferase n=1 Tax=Teredinibacter haidensis TaxID=2731755 RepID=UPI000948DE53|nr:lysophospholipid acyltransferase family protein [Teredinibacter haidensis]